MTSIFFTGAQADGRKARNADLPIQQRVPSVWHEVADYVTGPECIIRGWLRRLDCPERNHEAVRVFNEHVGAYIGLRIEADGSVARTEITKGPQAD